MKFPVEYSEREESARVERPRRCGGKSESSFPRPARKKDRGFNRRVVKPSGSN